MYSFREAGRRWRRLKQTRGRKRKGIREIAEEGELVQTEGARERR